MYSYETLKPISLVRLKLLLTPSRNIVNISDLGVRDLFRSNLTSPLLVRGPHYTHVYLLHAVYSQTLFTC